MFAAVCLSFMTGSQEVVGSTPIFSTSLKPHFSVGFYFSRDFCSCKVFATFWELDSRSTDNSIETSFLIDKIIN
jgi:hypothetical protein